MSNLIEVKVPDIGDFKDIPVIEVLVKPGDRVKQEDSLITLESDKATMEVPAPHAGIVKDLRVKVGDKVSQGSLILVLEGVAAAAARGKTGRARGQSGNDRGGGEACPRRPCCRFRRTCRQRRFPRRSRGAGFGSRRLYGGVPRRRSGQTNGLDRTLSGAGRCLPERRLHSLQGAAACGHGSSPRPRK